ncbi:MAG: alpha/beta hydrolase [Ruminococcus sp.]|nr:alpha/beta hydrolase [Ruminococcus sp.]
MRYSFGKTEIDYQVKGDGRPVLFLHGWGMDKRLMTGCFEPVFKEFDDYRRFYIDLPGMGASIAGDIVNSDGMLEAVSAFAVDVIGEPCIVAGESYGGLIARGFINKCTDMTAGLILLCPCVIPGVRQGRVETLAVMERDDKFLSTLTKAQYDSFTYMNVVLTRPVYEHYMRDIQPAIDIQDRHFLDEVLDGAFTCDVDDVSVPYDQPCLIIAGKQDSEVGYKDQFDLMRNFRNSTYCALNKAGHNLQIEQPELFQGIVKSWLADNFS